MDFTIIERAGITQAQFGELVGVTRFTVNTWVKKKFQPRPGIRARAAATLQALDRAVNQGLLPVPKSDHDAKVKEALRKVAATVEAAEG